MNDIISNHQKVNNEIYSMIMVDNNDCRITLHPLYLKRVLSFMEKAV